MASNIAPQFDVCIQLFT